MTTATRAEPWVSERRAGLATGLTRRQVHSLVVAGALPVVRLTGRSHPRIRVSDLERVIRSSTTQPVAFHRG